MEEDNVYPNNGEYFLPREPKDQIIGRKKERAKTLEGIDELKAVVKRLEERIEFYERRSSIGDDVRLDPQKFLILDNSYCLTAKTLRLEKEYIESLLDTHKSL